MKNKKVIFTDNSKLNNSKDFKKELDDLDKLVEGSKRVILEVKAVFPFNFFPDEIIIDETKVSIHTNYFFLYETS